MHNTETIFIPDEETESDLDYAAEEDLLEKDDDNLPVGPVLSPTHFDSPTVLLSNSPTFAENASTQFAAMCVICNEAPAYRNGPGGIYPTCGKTCASKLQAGTGLPNSNQPRTSRLPGSELMSSVPPPNNFGNGNWSLSSRSSGPPNSVLVSSVPPPDIFENGNWSSGSRSSEPTRTYAATTRPRPNQIRMCDVCHVRPRCQRGGRIYPTCGLSCAAKLHAPDSAEMCDYCKKRPKVVINGKTYPQCGKTCRDKAKLAEVAANAAACTSCILCWKSTKSGESDLCSHACESLADARAPFLIEIPRGHVAFKKVAERFTSDWQTSKTHSSCPTIKRIYMVTMKSSFKTSFENYRMRIGSQNFGILQRKKAESRRWLFVLRECGFGDPGDLEPCSSNKCLLCCIVRSSFNRLDFPAGISTSGLNRAVEHYRGGKKSSSKIAAMTHVLVGREAEMTHHDLQVVHPIPPQNTDSVHVFRIRNDGSKVDTGDIIVYDGDAVRPLYLISYE